MSNVDQPENPVRPAQGKMRNPKRRQLVTLGIFLAVCLAFVGGAVYFTRNNPDTAKVGDCVRRDGSDNLQVIGCDDPAAAFKVVGRVDNKAEVDASLNACDAFDTATTSFWSGEAGKTGFVLCLAPVH